MTVQTGRVRARGPREGDTTQGRAAAFTELVDREALDRAYRFATLMLGDRAEAEDAAHDAALTAWRHLDDLRDPERFEAWFGRILVNTCRDRLRSRRRVAIHSVPAEASDDAIARSGRLSPDPAEAIARRQALAQGLRSLKPEQREVIVLRFYLDLSIDQIAGRVGARPGTVKSRLHYAIQALRAALDEPTLRRFDR